jgi:type I restriction enzyme, S subunit
LMALCDALEARRTTRTEARRRLHAVTLHHVTAARSPSELDVHWSRLRTHFDPLHATPDSIPALRQTILQLAIQGRLDIQDARYEPAAQTIDSTLRKLGRKREPVANTDELIVPRGWELTRIEDVFDVAGGIQKTPMRTPRENAFPYLRVANVQRGRLDLSQLERFELMDGELERWRLERNHLLVVEGNGSENEIGRCALWGGEVANCVHQNHIIRCRPLGHDSRFAILFLNSPSGTAEMKRLAITTSGLYSLSVGKIRSIVIPFPPLAEQKRIVAKVEQLLALCDELETRLKDADARRERLLTAAIRSLLENR